MEHFFYNIAIVTLFNIFIRKSDTQAHKEQNSPKPFWAFLMVEHKHAI